MSLARYVVGVLILFALTAGAPAAMAERRVALIIGIDDYRHESLPDLKNARQDARGMGKILESLGFEVTLLIDANRRQFSRALAQFEGKLVNADVGLMFYAGHGVQADGVNWLIPSDAAIDIEADLRLGGVDAMEFLEAMERTGGKLNVLILDACRDNPLPERKRSTAKGLAPLSSSSGRTAIIYAASPGQTAADGKPGGHSVFTGEFIQALNTPGLSLEQVFKTTARRVSERTGGKQLPWMNTSFTGEFYFRPKVAEKPVEPTVTAVDTRQAQMEALFWQTIKNSTNPDDYAAYLSQFPSGVFAPLARNRMKTYSGNPAAPDRLARLQPKPEVKTEPQPRPGPAKVTVPTRTEAPEPVEPPESGNKPIEAQLPGVEDGPIDLLPPIIPKKKPVDELTMASLTRSVKVSASGLVNMRRGPSTDHPVVDQISDKNELVLLGQADEEGWMRVAKVNGRAGYVLGSLLDAKARGGSESGPTAVRAGETFRDCPKCPEMVIVEPGRFLIGDLRFGGESGMVGEFPIRPVNLAERFAVGKFEVSQREWLHLMKKNPSKFKNMSRPVENVSWEDAQDYLSRLSKKTGKAYRLLSEAEWEYVTRAGTTTVFYWGNVLEKGQANCEDCGTPWSKKKTAPVGRFPPNPLGIHDLAGNVREWTADCMTENYESLPLDGRPQTDGDCTIRITRGGGWGDDAAKLRSAARSWSFSGESTEKIGFRVAVTLDP